MMERYFGGDGLLARVLRQYEPRPEQLRMAMEVAATIRDRAVLLVEAGTGVGKSLAYLIPLIEWVQEDAPEGQGPRRAVVSTYTKTLQRQLVEKDLPLLAGSLFPGLRYALCLGSENYLCLRRLDQARVHGLFEDGEAGSLHWLRRWARKTLTGLRSETDVPLQLWQKVCRESDLCFGRECRQYDVCFYQRAKSTERSAQILVTNHHLFFAHIASGSNVLPSFETAVFDEAHELEDVASDYLGVEVSNVRLRHLLDSVLSPSNKGVLGRLKGTPAGMAGLLDRIRVQADAFFTAVSMEAKNAGALRIRERNLVPDRLSVPLSELAALLEEMAPGLPEEEGRELAALACRSASFSACLRGILGQEWEGHVYWAEQEGRRVRLVATPLDIAGRFRSIVLEDLRGAVLTSATLSTDGGFGYMQERLGIPDSRTLLMDSPFIYQEQAILYIPDSVREPGKPGFEEDLTYEIREILSITGGRTLVLFTSYRLLDTVYRSLVVSGFPVLRQGDQDPYRLIQEFTKLDNAVLLGTLTFWQGIDLPGDYLRCVVITKLPFEVPDDPVTEARLEALERTGKNPFYHYQVPRAAILLKQGFGRLIRTRTDRGIVAILDARILRRGYGAHFLNTLPGCKITASLDEVRGFFAGTMVKAGKG